jgi:hypothetical protein
VPLFTPCTNSRQNYRLAVVLPMTVLDAIIQSLSRAGEYNRDDQRAPALIRWPDKERPWEPPVPS